MGYGGRMQHVPPQICWGKENEDKACHLDIENWLAVGEIMEVTPSGLQLMVEKPFLGASSDGKVYCRSANTCCIGCTETKCPYSIDECVTIELSPDEIEEKFGYKFFMKRGKDGNLHLPTDHLYYAQIQGEMAIIGVQWCDFVVHSNGRVIVDQIITDADYWNNLSEKLEQLYVTHVIPEILSAKILKLMFVM